MNNILLLTKAHAICIISHVRFLTINNFIGDAMLINLSEILSGDKITQDFQVASDMKEFSFKGNEYMIDAFPAFTLKAVNTGRRKAHIEADFKVVLKMLCDRCLDEVVREYDVNIDEDIDMSIFESDKVDEINELNYLDNCNVDMDVLLRKELISVVPMQVLCREECKGLCKVCGANLNYSTCDCDDFVPDPRLSVFANILKNQE